MTGRAAYVLLLLVCPPAAWAQQGYATENVVIAVMDGTSWNVTFGDPAHRFIPRLWNELRPQGTLYTSFFNNDVTITKAGHSNLTTGRWQKMRNRGPRATAPTLFEYLADEQGLPPERSWVVFGKGAYAYDPTSTTPGYQGRFRPRTEMGIGESTLQGDHDVFEKTLRVMREDRPKLLFVNFGATDHLAHSGVWERHIKAIRSQDELLVRLWGAIQSDPHYTNKTTLVLTNDHGYHHDGVHEGFAEHGDDCEGCRHIMLLIVGPDTKKGAVVESPAYQIDVAPTVGELLGFQTPLAQGEILRESFEHFLGRNVYEARTDAARRAVAAFERARGNVVADLAERYVDALASLAPTLEGAVLVWGMLSAFDKTKDERYLDAVRAWTASPGEQRLPNGLVLAEFAYRLPKGEERDDVIERARGIADGVEPDATSAGETELALSAIFLSATAELTRDRGLWTKSARLVLDRLSARDHRRARESVETLRSRPLESQGERMRDPGKLVPTVRSPEGSRDNSWLLLALAFVRSHGLPFKGEYFSDVPDLMAESALQTHVAMKALEEPGDLWAEPLRAALSVAAIEELSRRVDLFERMERLTEGDVLRLRPLSPELLPRLEEIREQTRKVSAVNYNTEYGFPPYRDFDYTVDLLRLHVGEAENPLEVGAFLLALDPDRRIPFASFVDSPRAAQ